METDIDDLRLLDDLDFLFEDDELRFGLENSVIQQETFRVELFDDSNRMYFLLVISAIIYISFSVILLHCMCFVFFSEHISPLPLEYFGILGSFVNDSRVCICCCRVTFVIR